VQSLQLFENEEKLIDGWDDARVHLLEDFAKVFKGMMTVLTPDRLSPSPPLSLPLSPLSTAAFAVSDMAKSRALGHLMNGADEVDTIYGDSTEGGDLWAFAKR
jgi:hypothetical protein